jgi:hypothetical protein
MNQRELSRREFLKSASSLAAVGMFGGGANLSLVSGAIAASGKPIPPPFLPKTSFNYWDILKEKTFWLIGTSYLFISLGVYIVSDFIVTYGVVELKFHILSPQPSSAFWPLRVS